ncbi:MAG: glycosyltransferase [Lachnospiraceae bacterium]|nr:glycosyltransferase [Lachnospiraceae bacterium]
MKKKLIILLDTYPFGAGEYSFIRTELEKLVECFEVCILSVASSTEQKMMTDERISVCHCMRTFGIREKLEAVFGFCFSQCGRKEIKMIIKARKNIFGRFYDSLAYFSMADQVRKYAKQNHIADGGALIYSYWSNPNCLAFLMDRKSDPNRKVISRIHGYDLYNERNPHNRQPFREYMDEMIDNLFFVADAGLEYYLAHWGDKEEAGKKYIVAPIGTVDNGYIRRKLPCAQRTVFHIVSCSHVIPLKRVPLIIEGLSGITDIEIRWTHFGTGSHYKETVKYADRLLADKKNILYEMTGFVPVEEIMRFYAENCVDCFLTTSSTEGSPVSVQEAMSFGIPIIATAVGEIPNMIDGNGILLSENPRAEDVSDAINRLYHMSAEKREKMCMRSRALWEQKYNAEKNAEKFVGILQEISGGDVIARQKYSEKVVNGEYL